MERPVMRGWLHAGTAPIALIAGIVLISLAEGAPAKIASAVYLASSLLLFAFSAVYHIVDWSPKMKATLRRVDHANIFLLIAGTYTPLAVGMLKPDSAKTLLILVWSGALLGIGFRVLWLNAPRWLYVPLYIGLGWVAMFYLGEMYAASAPAVVLVIIGGLFYTVGAVFYGAKWPLRANRRFGFHELFHSCTIIAFFCHWVAALLAVT